MIYDEAERLARLVGNLLDMTRLATDTLAPRREWQSLERSSARRSTARPALEGASCSSTCRPTCRWSRWTASCSSRC